MDFLTAKQWSPYVAGALIGALSWVTFVLSDKPLGCSTAFSRTGGMIERLLFGSKVLDRPYYKKFAPSIDWEWMMVIGIVIGSFISSCLSGGFNWLWVPDFWSETIGNGRTVRWLCALSGGIIMGFGARWAGGCTSGHGISGTLQLAVSSWLAALSFFVGGIASAMLIFHVLI
ncbi:MAG: YeeE/YedE family protein [Sedimentisphaerales bacterium]|nr:YeeE/YedE family protein [Sedimentisphaerales bacterium]